MRKIHSVHKVGGLGAIAMVGLPLVQAAMGEIPAAELLSRVPVAALFGYLLVIGFLWLRDRVRKSVRSVRNVSAEELKRARRGSGEPRRNSK